MQYIQNHINLFIFLNIFLICFLLIVLYLKISEKKEGESVLKAKENLRNHNTEKIKSISKIFFSKQSRKYDSIQVYLSQIGANYKMKREVEPIEFVFVNLLIGVLLAIIGVIFFGNIGVVGFFLGYNFLKITLYIANEQDNDAIVDDIRSIYKTLIIKQEGGMFLTLAIAECYKVVENERLKEALSILTSEISTKNDIKEAIDKFRLKFRNKYISKFCTIVRQYLETGQAMNSLVDITEQLNSMQKVIELKETKKLETETLIIIFAVFSMMLAMIFYAVIYSFSITANNIY